MTDNFKMPVLHVMDRVLVSQNPTFADPVPGWIVKVKSNGADVVVVVHGRMLLFHDSMYYDDPRVEQRPQLFVDGDRGVFRLAQSELDQRAIVKELADQRELIDQLAAQVALGGEKSSRAKDIKAGS